MGSNYQRLLYREYESLTKKYEVCVLVGTLGIFKISWNLSRTRRLPSQRYMRNAYAQSAAEI